MARNELRDATGMIEEMLMMCDGEALDAIQEVISDGLEAGQGDYSRKAWERATAVLANLQDAVKAQADDIGYKL